MIRIGFLNNISRELMMEVSTSFTSPETRAMISPLRSSEKNPRGSSVIFLLIWLRISRTTPVRIGIIVKKAIYIVPTFRNVEIIRKAPKTISVNEPPSFSIRSLTNQKKLFFISSGVPFQLSQVQGSNTQAL